MVLSWDGQGHCLRPRRRPVLTGRAGAVGSGRPQCAGGAVPGWDQGRGQGDGTERPGESKLHRSRTSTFSGCQGPVSHGARGAQRGRGPGGEGHCPRATADGCEDPRRLPPRSSPQPCACGGGSITHLPLCGHPVVTAQKPACKSPPLQVTF